LTLTKKDSILQIGDEPMINTQPSSNETTQLISHHQRKRIPLLLYGIITGAFTGIIVCIYRFTIDKASKVSLDIYGYLSAHPLWIPVWLILLALLAVAVRFIVHIEPLSRGSGIPQTEGVLLGQVDMNWWRVLITKFTGGLLCMFAGFSLGREGPSIQLGGAVGQGIRKLFKRPETEEAYLITGGASAGLAAAFNAPLSGVIFALEEVHGHFSPAVLITAMASAIVADLTSKLLLGGNAVLGFSQLPVLPLQYIGYLLVLGLLLGAGGALFNYSILKSQDAYSLIPEKYRLFLPFAVCCVVGLFLPAALGGGSSLIMSLSTWNSGLGMMLLFLFIRFAFTMICFGSGAPGGIFLPLLTIGALLGAVFSSFLVRTVGVNPTYIPTFVALAMAGYFASVVRAPVTGIILITEMTGSFSHLLSLSIVVIISYLTAEMLGSKPIYESLLDRLLKKEVCSSGKEKRKEIIESVVYLDSVMDNRKIKDIDWPDRCLVVGVRRGSEEIIPNGDTVLRSGDMVILISDADRALSAKKQIQKLATRTRY
jgi:H+/Cl- antiporter ClcA